MREKEPLLPKPSHGQLSKLADVVAAVRTHKLPSQKQADAVLGALQDHLTEDINLSSESRKLVSDSRRLVASLRTFGSEKNHDDIVQELYYQLTRISKAPSRGVPKVSLDTDVHLDTQSMPSKYLTQFITQQHAHRSCSSHPRRVVLRYFTADRFIP